MIEKVRDLVTGNSEKGLMMVIILILLFIAAAAVGLVIMTRNKGQIQPFKEMPDDPESPPPGPPAFLFGSQEDEDDRTRRLFPSSDIGLKSYQLELSDVNNPNAVYRVNMSDRIVIGRKHTCTVSISNHTLSGEHCEITLRNGKLYIRDMNSLNGTYLNQSSERLISEQELFSGSLITMGQVNLLVNVEIIGM